MLLRSALGACKIETSLTPHDMIQLSQTKAIASHFRGSSRFGRTTTLVNKQTGEKLVEVMGAASRKEAFAAYVSAR